MNGRFFLISLERICTTIGALGLLVVGAVYIDSFTGAQSAIADFEQTDTQSASEDLPGDKPLALLNIRRLNLEVPVFNGTDPITLNRGAGTVTGAALPGENGNVVISAHRDSFFRPLKDLMIGDVIELSRHDGVQQFEVREIFITDPLDISVLDQSSEPLLTLITCYPFYYVGFAPDRYIVRATPVNS